jgi:hypothetical protein
MTIGDRLQSVLLALCLVSGLLGWCSTVAVAQDSPQVKLILETAGSRAVEPLTERNIVRDYTAAWKTLAEASENSSADLLDSYFAGDAKTVFRRALSGQQTTGVTVRYLHQLHNLKALFYAPEGDVMELQDAAEYELQILSGKEVIHDEHVTVQYIVLMTPAADRWVVRHLQAVPAM